MSAAVLQIGTPAPGVFVLNASELDGPDLLASGPTEANVWQSILADATEINCRRGGSRDAASTNSEVGWLTAAFVNGLDPIANASTLRPGVPVRLGREGSDQPDFSGTLRKILCTYEKRTKAQYVTLSATDGVEALANTTRYGAATPDGSSEPWPDRFARLFQSSPIPWEAPSAINPEHVELDHIGSAESGQWSSSWVAVGDVLTYNGPDGVPVARVFTGLEPGVVYTIATLWELSPSPITLAIDAEIISTQDSASEDFKASKVITFRATDPTHTLTAVTGVGYYLWLYHLTFTRTDYVPWAPNIATEANLAAHLDIAATSAGVAWIVDRRGTGKVVTPSSTPVLHFTDADAPIASGLVEYTDASVAFDTDNIVNDLAVINQGVAGDPPAATATSSGPYQNVTSVATYGSKTQQANVAIAVDGANLYTDGVERFAQRVLAARAEPQITISDITFDATDQPEVVDAIELQVLVRVTWRTVTRDLVITAIEHKHLPRLHQVKLTLGDPS